MTIIAVVSYFVLLLIVGRLTRGKADNTSFYNGGRRSPWYLVAFGMIGASISGVTFVSVPGMVLKTDMTYLQTCIGFIFGYFIVSFVLLPLYYRLNLTTIYGYLEKRFGRNTHLTGAWFFLMSKLMATSVKFYVACIVVYSLLSNIYPDLFHSGLGFVLIVIAMIILVWLYSHQGGIRTLVWTDTIQTLCILSALVLIIIKVIDTLDISLIDALRQVSADSHSRVFVFDDFMSTQNFWKQTVSGAFIVVVMTGLDQDMMQKNLTCRSLRDAQKDMCSYGFAFLPTNLLFLVLGILLIMLANSQGLALPEKGDELLPMFVATGKLGEWAMTLFVLGIIAASFSSADSALTALTTSYCVDIRKITTDEHLRRRVHIMMAFLMTIAIIFFHFINSTSVIDAIYIMVGYTYGPLLGLFVFGLFTKKEVHDKYVPLIAVMSPICCYLISIATMSLLNYKLGYELLLLNGLITVIGLIVISKTTKQKCKIPSNENEYH